MSPALSSSKLRIVPAVTTPHFTDEELIDLAVKNHGFKISPDRTLITTPDGHTISRNPEMPLGTSIHTTLRALALKGL